MIDLLVAGGGPAGLATALHAARAGMSVTVLEPRPAPTDKACGEGLMPGAVAALDDLGVDSSAGWPLRGICWLGVDAQATADFRDGPGRGVRRTDLHVSLRAAVDAAGIDVLARPATDIRQDAASVSASGLTARWLAAADGLHSPIRRGLGLDVGTSRRAYGRHAARYGQRAHFPVAPWTDHVEVHWSRDSEAYVTPVGSCLVGVAILSTRRASYQEHLTAFPRVLERIGGAAPTTSVRGAGPLRQSARARVAGRVLLVGDAAGYVDALTGEGIALACAEAAALVGCLVDDRPDAYEQRWRAATRSYRVITNGLLWTRERRLLAPLIVPAASRLPRVFDAAVHQLAAGRSAAMHDT